MFDPPKVRKVKILKLLWGFFRRQFAYFCLFWHLNRPRPAAQWVRPNFFGPEGGQTIPPHHSIAKYLKNLKSMSRTGTFILGHCVKTLLKNPNGKAKAKTRKTYHVLTAVTSSESVIVPMNMKIGKNLFALLINAISEKCKRSLLTKAAK